ncbi:thermonuclease family protein [Bacillus sp. 03113]|uniref:thermonuclease family protein n=1 Tax=Bacillus sp. 03113 TaxID=2578211 RepID=UPI0015E8786A|nr:thermonuclease family protein [Bacillus sp. 03113]
MKWLSAVLFMVMISGCSIYSTDHSNDQKNSNEVQEEFNQNKDQQTEFKRVKVKLIKPIDGDTVEVMYQGSNKKVRLLLIDTPETSHPRLGKQPYGEDAKNFTRAVVEKAKMIELEFDIGPKHDKYSRLLAYVYADGKMVQEELLKEGLARVAYVYPPNTRYIDQFNLIQKESQKKGIGIWKVENYSQKDGFHPKMISPSDQQSINYSSKNQNKMCNIKGNINSKGDKIYHLPNSRWYSQTKPEAWFCSETEAQEAGFHSPKQ